ncbi:Serine carboxypeptidase S28 [Cryptotrichosporon argae]
MVALAALAGVVALAASPVAARLDAQTHRELLLSGRPQIGLFRALSRVDAAAVAAASNARSDDDAQHAFSAAPHPLYTAHYHTQPVSHFDPAVNGTFGQRYWADASAYTPGGPVFVLDGGETSGEDRLPFLEHGILQILANATGGLAIVLEHRYYGDSVPVGSLSTDDLRFLNNAEALQDSADFIQFFEPPKELGITHSLHPNDTAWIYYGGSYAGARAAHMRVQYPELVAGAIASSAVTHAQIDFPQYYDPIQSYGPPACIAALQSAIKTVDAVLALPGPAARALKALFGLAELGNADFGDVLSSPLGYWQAQNWDPAVSTTRFTEFCEAMTAGGAGSHIGLVRIPAEVVNYANYIKENVVARCPTDVVDCFGTDDDAQFRDTGLDQTWRLWLFQVCTQWGYFQPAPTSGPSIVSSFVTLEHASKICRQAFPPGAHYAVPARPDVDDVNARGDYAIRMDRLAFIDGDRDPWRPMTPQADAAPKRKSTTSQPAHVIYDAIHHYDENGLASHEREPPRIRRIHELEIDFVRAWLEDWAAERTARD